MTTHWAVITGAGSGIGAVIARHAVKEGYRVAAWDVDGDAVRAVAEGIGEPCVPEVVDITDDDAVARSMAALPVAPSLVVNNAGVVRFGPLLDLAAADWRSALEVNLTGTFLVARAAAARMIDGSVGGAIVNISSINGLAAAPGAGAYTASKAGVVMLGEHMALEWGGHGIRVNTVAPGLIDAGMSDAIYADPEVRRLRSGRVPLGRLGTAEDVAATVLFLASDKAAYITGQTLAVDGGITRAALNAMPRASSPVPDAPVPDAPGDTPGG